MAVPSQPPHNLQDDLTPKPAGDANLDSSQAIGTFGHLQRSHQSGGVVPDYPTGDTSSIPQHGGSSGGSD